MPDNLTAEDIKKVVTWMVEEIGCMLSIPGPNGWYNLSGHINGFSCFPQVLVEIFKNSDTVFAKMYGVEKDLYIRWKNNWDNDTLFRCRGITKKGRRCLNECAPFCTDPKDFDEMSDYYCRIHENQRVVKRS